MLNEIGMRNCAVNCLLHQACGRDNNSLRRLFHVLINHAAGQESLSKRNCDRISFIFSLYCGHLQNAY